jgi:hypothetical protein
MYINLTYVTPKSGTMQCAVSGGSCDGNVYMWQVLVTRLLPTFLHSLLHIRL